MSLVDICSNCKHNRSYHLDDPIANGACVFPDCEPHCKKFGEKPRMRVFHVRCSDCPWNTFDVEGFGEERTIKAQEIHSINSGHRTELIIEEMSDHQKEFAPK